MNRNHSGRRAVSLVLALTLPLLTGSGVAQTQQAHSQQTQNQPTPSQQNQTPGVPAPGSKAATPRLTTSALSAERAALAALFTKVRPGTLRLEECPAQGSCAEPDGIGTGFLISADGLALTAYHVVAQTKNLVAVTLDKKRYPLSVVGFDEGRDLALVKVNVPAGTPFLPLALASPKVTEAALVVGNGNGEFLRSASGHVLGLETPADRADFPSGTLKLSAPLVPGDSGGPVINARGEVVGVVSYISVQGRAMNITSYAVPVTTTTSTLSELRKGVKNEAPVIGVSLMSELVALDEGQFKELRDVLKLGDTPGAFFTAVSQGSPAARAGLKPFTLQGGKVSPGDIVTAVNGKRIKNFIEFQFAVRAYRPGDSVTLSLLRDGKPQQVKLTLVARSTVLN